MTTVDPTLDVNASIFPEEQTETVAEAVAEAAVAAPLPAENEDADAPFSVMSAAVPIVESADISAMLQEVAADDAGWADVLHTEGASPALDGGAANVDADDEAEFTMEDLFGEALRPDELEGGAHEVLDPVLYDTTRQIDEIFHGLSEDEEAALLINPEAAARNLRAISAHEEMAVEFEDAQQALTDLFGVDVDVKQLAGEASTGTATSKNSFVKFLYSSLPEPPKIPHSDALWLVDFPKVEPNRQVLHVEPEPFTTTTTAKHSDDRRLYTPHNVIRWTYRRNTKECLSNARLVMWSDGTTSLQVGKDLYDVVQSQEAAYNMIASPALLASKGHSEQALIATVHPDEHLTLKVHSAKNTIDHTLVHEGRLQRAPQVTERLALADRVLPEFADKKVKPSAQEEFANRAREQRKRRMRTEPMSLTEQFQMEFQLFDQLHRATAEDVEDHNDVDDESTKSYRQRKRHSRELVAKTDTASSRDDEAELDRFQRERNAAVDPHAVEEPVAKARRLEQTPLAQRVLRALQDYSNQIPETNTAARGSVDGLAQYLDKAGASDEAIAREVPKLLRELRREHKGLDALPHHQALLDAVGFSEEL